MNLWNQMKTLVTRDVANDNETKKASVIMRMFTLIMCVYFVLQIVVLAICGDWRVARFSVLCLLGYALAFYCTYLNRTRMALTYMQLLTIFWFVVYVYLLGWDCGVQHFLFVLVVLIFVASYAPVGDKLARAAILCVIRLALYVYTKNYAPVMELNIVTNVLFQFINTVAIFTEMTVIVMIFSQESLDMEKKLVDYNEKIRQMASIDPLTKLYNRRAIMDYVTDRIQKYNNSGTGFNIAIGDIDFFKQVNDTYGHEAGDLVLKSLAEQFLMFMHGKGKVARWGGEEFLFIMEGINGDEAFVQLEGLRSMIQDMEISYEDQIIRVTMTLGLEEYSNDLPIDYTINNADKKLYMGKTSGRNKIVF